MAWIDRVENTIFTIRTGDGREYTPLLPIGYEKSTEYNVDKFDYINVAGSDIVRKKPRASNFPLTFLFTGEDCIEQADAFDASCNDPRAWVVRHPIYGDINGQPIQITRSDQNLNATQFTVDFWETIILAVPVIPLSPQEQITSTYTEYYEISPIEYESKVALKPADVNIVKQNANYINNLISKSLDAINYSEYQQQSNAMFTAIDNLINQPVDAVRNIHQVVMTPSRFFLAVETRIDLIVGMYNGVSLLLEKQPTANNKAYFETIAGVAIISLANTILNPFFDGYITRSAAINAANNLAGLYANYLAVLNNAYVTLTGTAPFSPSFQTQNILQNSVINTMIAMQNIAFNSKVERTVILDKDSQLIVLTHKYMGLASDENIETFRTINNIKNANLFLVPKGTEITYYS